jgi:hypothetical protein
MSNLQRLWLASAALLLSASFAWTNSAQATDTQKAENGGIYRMPAGDFRTAADYEGAGQVIPRRSPVPDEELMRLKALVPTEDAAGDAGAPTELAPTPRALFTECVTNAGTGFAPSDIHGAASPNNLIVVTNVDISVRSKTTCAVVSAVSLKTFFNNFTIPATETLFDPRVVYDRLHSRCIVTAESRNSGNTDQFLYVAMSTNSSCTSWRRIRFVLSRVSTNTLFCKAAASDFYDYPNVGYMGTRIVVTSNNFPTEGATYGTILSINKTEMMNNQTVSARCFRPVTPNTTPAIVSSSSVTQMFLLATGNAGSGSSLGRRRLNVGADTPNDTLTTLSSITIPAWTAPPDAVQPNNQKLDTLDGRFQSATKQIGGNLWNVHAVNVGGFSRWRMYKLSTSGTSVLFSRTPTTSTCPNADHLFNPSIDTNSSVSGTLAFVTASRTCPTLSGGRAAHLIFRGNNSSNTGWVFTNVEVSATQFTTESSVSCNVTNPPNKTRTSCRWGDYSATQIDPSNTGRAWGFNQLVTGTVSNQWNTRAGLVGP